MTSVRSGPVPDVAATATDVTPIPKTTTTSANGTAPRRRMNLLNALSPSRCTTGTAPGGRRSRYSEHPPSDLPDLQGLFFVGLRHLAVVEGLVEHGVIDAQVARDVPKRAARL